MPGFGTDTQADAELPCTGPGETKVNRSDRVSGTYTPKDHEQVDKTDQDECRAQGTSSGTAPGWHSTSDQADSRSRFSQ
jgi:hypothetical protein